MSNINKIRLSGTTYDIEDLNAAKTVELTQAQYDALVTKDPNTFYIITDAEPVDMSDYYTKSETSGATEISTALASKADTATTYTKTEVDTALGAKQATLISGTNIKTVNNQSLLGEGNIEIQGGSVDVDPTLDGGSSNPVANSAITNGFNTYTLKRNNDNGEVRYFYVSSPSQPYGGGGQLFSNFSINGRCPLTQSNGTNNYIDKFSLVETSAITSSVTSASTDSQVPSAKAVYDALQESGGGTVDTQLDSLSENPVQNKVIYQKFDEVEEVTAAALNALNDKMGDVETLLASI